MLQGVCQQQGPTTSSEFEFMPEASTSYLGSLDGMAKQEGSIVIHHHVPHFQQYFSWDCGLACVLMVLKALAVNGCDYQTLRQMCPTTSIWTVDLAHLLRRFGLDVCFLTTTLGPNPAYANEGFYIANIQEDQHRVSRLFSDASAAGIAVQKRSLSASELQEVMLTGVCLVIALVDKRKLNPRLVRGDSYGLPTLLPGGFGEAGYTGHYILIIGFDAAEQRFIVRDPAMMASELHVSSHALDLARMSFGTDEDLIIVPCAPRAGSSGSVAEDEEDAESEQRLQEEERSSASSRQKQEQQEESRLEAGSVLVLEKILNAC